MSEPKEKRRGGVYDESVYTIFLNREQLIQLIEETRCRFPKVDDEQNNDYQQKRLLFR